MATDPNALIERLFARMMDRDLPGMMLLFAEDAVVFDPHYPIPTMKGHAAIERGLRWALDTLVEPGFTVRQMWLEGDAGGVEVHTTHVLKGGMKLDFEQVFLFEIQNDQITRLRAFVPHPPPGIGGWIAQLTGMWWRLRGEAS